MNPCRIIWALLGGIALNMRRHADRE